MKPKVLIVDLNYYDYSNANTACLNRILNNIHDYDFSLVAENPLVNKSQGYPFTEVFLTKVHKLKTFFANEFSVNTELLSNKIKSLLLNDGISYKRTADSLRSISDVDFSGYNMILSISNPIESHVVASTLSTKYGIPWIAYNFDPFSTNGIFDKKSIDNRIKKEKELLNTAARIILTDPISEDYGCTGILSDKQEKTFTVKIPGIRTISCSSQKSDIFDDKYINCLFLGNLYWDIRNPMKTIELFEHMSDDIRLYFIGGSYGKTNVKDQLSKEAKIDKKKIFFMDPVDSQEAEKIMMSADVLVNIGNTVTNQLPSKIFDYISSGKPILNIYKNNDCPSLKILSDYPKALSVAENGALSNLETIQIFLKTTDFQEVEEVPLLYTEYTGQYVAKIVKDALNYALQ